MNVETANKLVKLRKSFGLSQEVFGIITFMIALIIFFILGFFYGRWIPFMFMVVPIFYFIPYLRKK